MNSKKRIIYIVFILFLLFVVSGTYAFFTAIVSNDASSAIVLKSGTMAIHYEASNEFFCSDAVPGWEESKSFTVTNTGSLTSYYDIEWQNVFNDFERTVDLEYKITGSYHDMTKVFPISDMTVLNGIGILPGEVHTYIITLKYINQDFSQNIDQGKKFGGKIMVTSGKSTVGYMIHSNTNAFSLSKTNNEVVLDLDLVSLTTLSVSATLSLSEINNTLSDVENLTYEVISGGNIISSGNLPLLASAILDALELSSKEELNLILKLKYTGSNTGEYSAIITLLNKENAYYQELMNIEAIVNSSADNNEYLGTKLTITTPISIRGLSYWRDWYHVTEDDLAGYEISTAHAPYIVRYTDGSVISINGDIINGVPLHTLNYVSEVETSVYISGILSGVTGDSLITPTDWGELTIKQSEDILGGGTYDAEGGLILGSTIATLAIDQSRPVNERYSINVTVKGTYPQSGGCPSTIVAISNANTYYLAWIGFNNNFLQIHSFYSGNAKCSINSETTATGYLSIDLSKEEYGIDLDEYLNIQVTAERNGLTKLYLNGQLIKIFNSGSAVLDYANLTIGDLRPNRGLKFKGSIYNFALYSEVIPDEAINQNWQYTKNQLNMK